MEVDYILHNRAPHEPIVAKSELAFHGSLYYAHHKARPLLLAEENDRTLHRFSAHLENEDFITPEVLLTMESSGVWFISSPSYLDRPLFEFPLPNFWKLVDSKDFKTDYRWEQPILVEHFRIQREGILDKSKLRGTP